MADKIVSVKDLDVYNLAAEAAMEIFEISKTFPVEEKYSLIDQIRKSSRSVSVNIREGFAKKRYNNVFIRHCTDSFGSSEETRGWLDYSLRCKYITNEIYVKLDNKYDRINAMLNNIIRKWVNFDDK